MCKSSNLYATYSTWPENISRRILGEHVFFQADSFSILTSSGVSHIEQTPCWSELPRSQGESLQSRHPRWVHAYVLLREWVALETRRRDPSRGVRRRCLLAVLDPCRGRVVCMDLVIECEGRADACLAGTYMLSVSARGQRWISGSQEPRGGERGPRKPKNGVK